MKKRLDAGKPSGDKHHQPLFENLPELITAEIAATALHTTRGTVYQWRARPKRYGVPEGMFIKHGRKLLIRRDVLVTWVLSRGS